MAVSKLPNIAFLRECLDYNPDTGVFTWRERPRSHFRSLRGGWTSWNAKWAGKVAGNKVITSATQSYWKIKLGSRPWKAHRLAWLMVHGEPVPATLDHINGDPLDNRISNLRPATRSQNGMNQRTSNQNTSSIKGVSRSKACPDRPFLAYITVAKKRIHLGYFPTLEEAAEARREAAIRLHGEFMRHQ